MFFPRIAVAAVAIVAALLNLNDGDDDDDSGYRINDGVNAEIDVDAKEVADITKDAATITAIADLAVRVIIVVVDLFQISYLMSDVVKLLIGIFLGGCLNDYGWYVYLRVESKHGQNTRH